MGSKNPRLHTDEALIALSICAHTDNRAKIAMEQLGKLKGCEIHSSVILKAITIHLLIKFKYIIFRHRKLITDYSSRLLSSLSSSGVPNRLLAAKKLLT